GLERPQWRVRAAVMDVERDNHDRAVLLLSDGTRLEQDAVLYCGRVCGNTDALNLSAAGLEVDDRGQLWCNERFQTWIPHIFGLGEVIGYPSAAGQLSRCGARFVDALLDVETANEQRGFECHLPERSLALV
ncbi:MAG: FAD-dependent oxidoreductase, partial [Planctomycetaceae bacterium]